MKIADFFSNYILPVKKMPAGLFVRNDTQSNGRPYRSHLRISANGDGLFILNASTIIQLNSTAAEYAYHFIKSNEADFVSNEISRRYRIKKTQAKQDYLEFIEKIQGLIDQPDLDPISNFGIESAKPDSFSLDIPLRLDCALTYDLPAGTGEVYSPKKRVTKELSTIEWEGIIDKSWSEGVPHLVFTGGEPTLRPDLPELLQKAEQNGQVTGLLTSGRKFEDKKYLNTLLVSGLDHITIILPRSARIDLISIQNVISEDIYFTVHATITPENKNTLEQNFQILQDSGVKNISLSTSNNDKKDTLKELKDLAYSMNFHLVEGLPLPYSEVNPVSLEESDNIINLTDDNCLYIEPDGDVLRSQGSYDNILGNILTGNIQLMFKNSKN